MATADVSVTLLPIYETIWRWFRKMYFLIRLIWEPYPK